MLKKILVIGLIAAVVLVAGVFFWARSVLTGETVRTALAAQVGKAIGQPVTIADLDAGVMPRVTVTLGSVGIGEPARITVSELHVGTDFRALLSRRIEHASVRLSGARIELPLPRFTIGSTDAPAPPGDSSPPVQLVSIDEILLNDVEIVSGGRTLRGDIEIVPEGTGFRLRKFSIGAGQTTIEATGVLTDLEAPAGDFAVKAGALNLDQLLAFANEFTAGAGFTGGDQAAAPASSSSSPVPAAPSAMNVALRLDAESATMGGLTLTALHGTARMTGEGLTLDPVSFGVFGGEYKGALALAPGKDTFRFRGKSSLSNVDVAAALKFGGSADVMTGRLSGQLDFAGSGADPRTVMKNVVATARLDVVDGVVRKLGLINSVVIATSMRTGSMSQAVASTTSAPADEAFTRLGVTLSVADGVARTDDLLFEAKDLTLSGQGAVQLVASTVDLKGRVQLSEALTQQAGRDLIRYTQDQGKVTLPATITGPVDAPSVRIDTGEMAKRALQNAVNEQKDRAREEAKKALSKKLGGLFGR